MYYNVCECDPGRQCERTEFVDQCEVFGCLRTVPGRAGNESEDF